MDSFLKVELFLKKLYDESKKLSLEDLGSVSDDNSSSYWGNWITDCSLREYFQKNDRLDDIRSINLTGSSLITDQGIIWLCEFLKKCPNLEKISLRSCSQLTENALLALLNHLDRKCSIELNHTNINFVPLLAPFFHTITMGQSPMGYTNTALQKDISTMFSLVIWPSKSLDVSGIGLITEKVSRPLKGNFLEYKSRINLSADGPLINIINYRYTEVPIHVLVPKNPGNIVIMVSDNLEEALAHVVETIVHFLSSEIPKFGEPLFEVIQEPKKPRRPVIQQNMVSKKPQKMKKAMNFEEVQYEFESDFNDTTLFSYKNITVTDNILRNWGDGAWISKEAIDQSHSHFEISCDSGANSMKSIKMGFCIKRQIMTDSDLEAAHFITFDMKQGKLSFFNEGQLTHQTISGVIPRKNVLMRLNLSDSPSLHSGYTSFFVLEVDGVLCWSRPIKIGENQALVPFLAFEQRNCSVKLSGDWILIGTFSNDSSSVTVHPSKLQRLTQFTIMCYGPNCEEVYKEIVNVDWNKKLERYKKKLSELISITKKKFDDRVEVSDCVVLGSAIRQLERLQEFIDENPKSKNKTVKVFSMKMYDEKVVTALIASIQEHIAEDTKIAPYRYSPSLFGNAADSILKLEKNYIKDDDLQAICGFIDLERMPSLLEKMFSEMSGIYVKKFGLFIINIDWFDSLLNDIAKSASTDAEYKSLGIHRDSKVWTKSSMSGLLDKYSIAQRDQTMWINFLMDLGLLVRIPCIRFTTIAEPYFYINPMEPECGKMLHLESIQKTRDLIPKKIMATVRYSKLCQDLYSLYPQLLSRIISIGNLQLLSPLATVIHVTGGIEVMIEADEDGITLSAYLPQQVTKEAADLKHYNLFNYVWSVMYLCTDAFDALLIEQSLLALKVHNLTDDPPHNYSVCYSHRWNEGPGNCNACTMCGNCTSSLGINCPYNRIPSQKRGHCLCLLPSTSCRDCGICKSCAKYHWTNYCICHPNQNLLLQSDGTTIPSTVLNVALTPKITIEMLNTNAKIFFGLKQMDSSKVIDIINKTIVQTDNLTPSNLNGDSIQVSFTEAPSYSDTDNKKHSYQLAVCRGIDFNEGLKILSYDHTSTGDVGIFVSHRPVSKDRNRFAIEVLNAGSRGYIAVGLVSSNYKYNRQPGWDFYSIGYHGDDGGIFVSSGSAKYCKDLYSTCGNKIDVITDYVTSDIGPDLRFVTFKLNGIEIVKEKINYDGDIYPAIGFHSVHEQVRLIDDLAWKDEQTCDQVVDDVLNINGINISPKDNLPLNDRASPVGIIHVLPGTVPIKSITLKLANSINILKSIESFNNLSRNESADKSMVFDVNNGAVNNVLSFTIELLDHANIDNARLIMDINVVDGGPVHVEWKVSERPLGLEMGYQKDLHIIEIPSPETPPTMASYLMTVNQRSKSRYYHIPKDNYMLIFKGHRHNVWIKSENMMRPSTTRSYQIGNIILFNSKYAIVSHVNKSKREINVTEVKESIDFDSDRIKPLSKPGKMWLSRDDKYEGIFNINKTLLTAPPPSRPSPIMFSSVMKENISDSDVFFANECDKYHGMNICVLNTLLKHEDSSKKTERCYSAIALPFKFENTVDFSQFLWEHSYYELFQCSKMLFYPLCAGRSLNFDSRPHILHIPGMVQTAENLDESSLFQQIYLNSSLYETHRKFINNKFLLAKTDFIIQQSRFTDLELEYLIFVILEKVTSIMLLHNILTKDKYLFNGNISLNLGKICNENYRALSMDGDYLSCRLHSTSFLKEIDLDELVAEYGGDIETLATNILLTYAEYSQSVVFTGRNLLKIPEKLLSRFCNLYSLELRNMFKIESIPETVYELRGLQRLIISRLNLRQLPELSRFQSLKHLSVSYSPVATYDTAGYMPRLETSKVISLPMTKLPTFITDSPYLTNLEIQLCGLDTLPKEFGSLQNLMELTISGSSLYYNILTEKIDAHQKCEEEFLIEYPEILQFKMSDIGKMIRSVMTASDAFINVPRIGSGYSQSLDKDESGGFPMAVLQLKNLTSLAIHHQSIRHVPKDIQKLAKLENINLSHNHLLESVPGELSRITTIKKINLTHCPALTVPPLEVISRGTAAILSYLKFLFAKKVTCNRTKLMLVGLGEAGKTSLLHALTSPENTVNTNSENKSITVTDGIDIGKYTIELPNNENIQFSTWDFAGQDVYYNTHQFFLSTKAIYIVVWSVRQGIEHGDLDFWLSSICCHAKHAPVLVVGTRCDQVQAQTSSFISLKERYPQIVNFYLVDSYTGTGIETLRKSLVETAMALPYMHQDIPSSILILEARILKLRQEKDFIPLKDFEDIAVTEGILEKDVRNVMEILHDFGSIQYFNTERLKGYVVINPQWIVDIMGKVVSIVDQKITDGIFFHKDMCNVWKDFDQGLHTWMLNLTEEFDLTYPHPTMEPRANVVPCLLTEMEPQIEWPSVSEMANWKYFQISYYFAFLPAGLFNRIQVRLFDFTVTKEIWKYGTYFMKNDHHVLLKRESKTKLTLRAIGVRPVNVLAMVDEVVRSLIRTSFFGVEFHMEIACPDCIEYGALESTNPTKYWSYVCMFSSKIIRKAISKKIPYLQCAELHLNLLKTIKESTPDTPSPEEFVADLYSKIQTVKGIYASTEQVVVMIHSVKDIDHENPLQTDRITAIFDQLKLSCIRINETCLTKWKTHMSNCTLCIIVLSDQFILLEEMNEILEYIKLYQKRFLVIITGDDSQVKSNWIHGPYFNTLHIKMVKSEMDRIDSRYQELTEAIKKMCVIPATSERKCYDCFISYCWSNSDDAVTKGSKMIPGAISCPEADPRRVCKYLQDNGVSCWIDDKLISDIGLSTQLSHALQESKMMIAFVSNEYDNSDNCKMELRFMAEVLRRPIIYVQVGNSFESHINSEVQLLMQRNTSAVFNFASKYSIAVDKLLECVKATREKCPSILKKLEEKENTSIIAALNEQVELIFRQFLNQLILSSGEHCPRLVVVDLGENKSGDIDIGDSGLELRVICESEYGWHVTEQCYHLRKEEADNVIDKCAVYLCLMYQVLEYKNPGLRCLHADQVNNNVLIPRITQIARSSEMKLEESYRNIIELFMKYDPDLKINSLKRYRLASGRDSWICEIDAAKHSRLTLIEKDTITEKAGYNPLDEYDKELLNQLRTKAAEEEEKYKASFASIMNIWGQNLNEEDLSSSRLVRLSVQRQNTMLLSEKEIVTNRAETTVIPIRRTQNLVTIKEELEKDDEALLRKRKYSSVPRQNISGSRMCLIQ